MLDGGDGSVVFSVVLGSDDVCVAVHCLRRRRLDPISDEMRSNGLKPALVPVCMHALKHIPTSLAFLRIILLRQIPQPPLFRFHPSSLCRGGGGLGLVDVSFATGTVYYVTTVLLPTSSVFFFFFSLVSTVFCFCCLRLRRNSTWNFVC